MKEVKYLLIGGGLSSCEAATAIREKDDKGSVLMVGAERHLPYNRPPLSKALLQGKKEQNEIFCQPSEFYAEKNIDVMQGTKIIGLDAANRTALCEDRTAIQFEKALLATGGNPVRLNIPGSNLPEFLYLRTLDDCLRLRDNAEKGKKAVVIGAGFIGMEISASLTLLGVEVTVIEAKDRIWPMFADEKLSEQIATHYGTKGVRFMTGESVRSVVGNEHVKGVVTESGKTVACDFVCCAVGIKPAVELAEAAGLEMDNGVLVNEYMETSNPNIYAAGDIANFPDPIFAERRRVEHWGQAEYTGGLAGGNMAGEHDKYGLVTYAWSDGFDLHYEFAGQEAVYDETLQRGKFGQENFVTFFLSGKRLRAYIAVNPEKSILKTLEKMVEQKVDFTGREHELTDTTHDITEQFST